nr:hypothetical protein [Pandoravirus massiliensis]
MAPFLNDVGNTLASSSATAQHLDFHHAKACQHQKKKESQTRDDRTNITLVEPEVMKDGGNCFFCYVQLSCFPPTRLTAQSPNFQRGQKRVVTSRHTAPKMSTGHSFICSEKINQGAAKRHISLIGTNVSDFYADKRTDRGQFLGRCVDLL